MEENKQLSLKWLSLLFYVHLAGCLLSVLALLATAIPFAVGSWYTWAQRAVSLAIAVCLMLLSGRYRLSGVLKVLALVCGLLPGLLNSWLQMPAQALITVSTVMGRTSTVLALVALFLEYIAHAAASPRDRTKWYIFLSCSLAVTVLSSAAVAVMQPLLNSMVQEAFLRFARVWNVLSRTLSLAVGIIYLVLLHRVIRTQQEVD